MFLLPALMLANPAPAPPPPLTDFEARLRNAVARSVVEVPPETTLISEPTLPEDTAANRGDQALNREDTNRNLDQQDPGLRVLAFRLAPGERLTLRQRRNLDLLLMNLVNTVREGPMHDEINKVNKLPAGMRNRGLKIRNLTPEPFPVLVRIVGPCNVPYQLEIRRGE